MPALVAAAAVFVAGLLTPGPDGAETQVVLTSMSTTGSAPLLLDPVGVSVDPALITAADQANKDAENARSVNAAASTLSLRSAEDAKKAATAAQTAAGYRDTAVQQHALGVQQVKDAQIRVNQASEAKQRALAAVKSNEGCNDGLFSKFCLAGADAALKQAEKDLAGAELWLKERRDYTAARSGDATRLAEDARRLQTEADNKAAQARTDGEAASKASVAFWAARDKAIEANTKAGRISPNFGVKSIGAKGSGTMTPEREKQLCADKPFACENGKLTPVGQCNFAPGTCTDGKPKPGASTPDGPSATVTSDVDLFEKPHGVGFIRILRKGEVVKVARPCVVNDHCELTGPEGFAWGASLKNN